MMQIEGVQNDVALAPETTLEVGGSARHLVRASRFEQLLEALEWARAASLPTFVLGGGSNVLVADGGFDGLVVQVALDELVWQRDPQGATVRVGAGVVWDALVEEAVAMGLTGLECLAGIPGWSGAAPVQNIGAYGQEVGTCLRSVAVVDRQTGAVGNLAAAACGLAYRYSAFKGPWAQRYAITSLELRLGAEGVGASPAAVTYPELQRMLAARTAAPGVAAIRAAVLELRRGKSMVYDLLDANHRSAGSFFTNPQVSVSQAAELRQRFGAGMPQFPTGDGVKLSAGWLIEQAGFARGTQRGRVGLSSRHALALINRGGATARDLVELALHIAAAVEGQFAVRLQAEPALLGFPEVVRAALQGAGAFELAHEAL